MHQSAFRQVDSFRRCLNSHTMELRGIQPGYDELTGICMI